MKRRFVAGAVCPRCGEMDRIVMFEEEGEQFKECVSCDYKEKQLAQVVQGEIATRVNSLSDSEEKEQVSVVKIMAPPPTKMD